MYLGSWIASSEHDFLVSKAKAWAACHKIHMVVRSEKKSEDQTFPSHSGIHPPAYMDQKHGT